MPANRSGLCLQIHLSLKVQRRKEEEGNEVREMGRKREKESQNNSKERGLENKGGGGGRREKTEIKT